MREGLSTKTADNIDLSINCWLAHKPSDVNLRRVANAAAEPMLGNQISDLRTADVQCMKLGASRDVPPDAGGEVVNDDDMVSRCQQCISERWPDETLSAG